IRMMPPGKPPRFGLVIQFSRPASNILVGAFTRQDHALTVDRRLAVSDWARYVGLGERTPSSGGVIWMKSRNAVFCRQLPFRAPGAISEWHDRNNRNCAIRSLLEWAIRRQEPPRRGERGRAAFPHEAPA